MIKIFIIGLMVLTAIFISPIIKFMKKRKEKKQNLTENVAQIKMKKEKEFDKEKLLEVITKIYNKEVLERKAVKDMNYDELLALITGIYNHDITVAEAFSKFIMPLQEVEQQK